ncbi:MAG: hypothetical protein NTX96_02005 [Candidatus Zambryskibacteria bacterium]|nr:hypothetical protein [Candidatus Zambryskibacteria bacterium]
MFEPLIHFFGSDTVLLTLKILYYFSFVFIPLILIDLAWDLWVQYRRALYFAKQEYILLEIKLPREIFKSPRAMEFCIAGLHSTSNEGNWYEKYWKGQVRNSHSLEIVSIDGAVHFFIRTKKEVKNQIEANLYSQYPGVEINEVPDYTLPVTYDPEKDDMFIMEFKLTKEDAYPIKTYIDYGMEKDPKEEFKIDPMTPLIEFMGSMSRGNQAWIQIIIRAHIAEEKDREKTFAKWKIWETWKMEDKWDFMEKKDLKWKEKAKEEIEKIIKQGKGEIGEDGKIIPGSTRFLTEDEQNTIKALGRSVSKKGFDTGIRLIYFAPKDIYNSDNKGGLIGGIMHFNSDSGLNGFKPSGSNYTPKYKHLLLAWKDRNKKLLDADRQDFLDAYKRRAYFYKPYRREISFVLNTEELATLFHLPGGVSATPTFTRIESRKGEAPANLPV